ncbi:MAG: bifunctional enoyl-CoA hydratase/phosphate acetyltransferase [Acidobacteria bacterium]|nr:bifunctional enoyl-CoA hydratase/phosphate acetyltransferase [Acidobacteriota bacterium]
MITKFDELIQAVKRSETKVIAVAYAHDPDVLGALDRAREEDIARGILVGPAEKIRQAAESVGVSADGFEIVDIADEKAATAQAVELVREGQADVLMKGLCSTSTLMSAVLNKETGLRAGGVMSHLAAFEIPSYPKLIILSDAAMNIAPDINAKISMIESAVHAARRLGIERPKVAIIGAVEKVNPESMPCTVDASILTQMNRRGQIKNCIIDGPLAVDNAFSRKSCEVKGIDSPVGGDADIAITPDIEAGNIFYKLMAYLAGAKTAGIIVGAKKPIVLTSRSDSEEIKFLSIVFAMQVS